MLEKFKRFMKSLFRAPDEPAVRQFAYQSSITSIGKEHANKKTTELILFLKEELKVTAGAVDIRRKIKSSGYNNLKETPWEIVVSIDGGRGRPFKIATIKVGFTQEYKLLYYLLDDKMGEGICCEDDHRLMLGGRIQVRINAWEHELSKQKAT